MRPPCTGSMSCRPPPRRLAATSWLLFVALMGIDNIPRVSSFLNTKPRSFAHHVVVTTRGGAQVPIASPDQNTIHPTPSELPMVEHPIVDRTERRKTLWIGGSVSIILLAWMLSHRGAILGLLRFVKDVWLPSTLETIHGWGWVGLVGYAIAFFIWECTVGITTPLETAAGMAFGVGPAIAVNGIGKLGGSVASFLATRYMQQHSSPNPASDSAKTDGTSKKDEMWLLLQSAVYETPFRVALCTRFAPVPEVVKNCGLAALPASVLPTKWFLLSVLLHGGFFTVVWSALGAATTATTAVPRWISPLLSVATWVGISANLYLAYWIQSLRRQSKQRQTSENDSSGPTNADGETEEVSADEVQ